MQRLQAVKPVEKPPHIRPAPTQCSRCWGAYWWCCASPRPGSAPHKWFSSRSSPSPVPFSSHGSAPIGTFSSSRSTTLGTWPLPEKNRRPFRNSGEVSMNESTFGQEVQQKLTGNLTLLLLERQVPLGRYGKLCTVLSKTLLCPAVQLYRPSLTHLIVIFQFF